MLLVHDEKIEDVTKDVKSALEQFNIKLVVQHIHHDNVVKIRHKLFPHMKIYLQDWIKFFKKKFEVMFKCKVIFYLKIVNINDGTKFKECNKEQGRRMRRHERKRT